MKFSETIISLNRMRSHSPYLSSCATSPKKEPNKRLLIYTRTRSKKSSKKIEKNFNANLLSQSMRRKSRVINSFGNNMEEIDVNELYKDIEESLPELIKQFEKIKDCSILKFGLKPSIEEIQFSFCRTCDPNLINPICSACINICHKSHNYKKTFLKGEIKCICGERLHCMSNTQNLIINNISCQLGEWFLVSKLNFYYKIKNGNCLCMLCYNFCTLDRGKSMIAKINNSDKSNIPNCTCTNEDMHQEKKKFFEKMGEIASKLDNYEYFNLLHPSQIINMMFLSKKPFQIYFSDLINIDELISENNFLESVKFNSFKKENFSSNCYLICRSLIEFIKLNRHTNLSFFCDEANFYFSFAKIKLVLSMMESMKSNEKSFYLLASNYLTLFHKIYIGNITQTFSKFKLNDLENFPCLLRWVLCNPNNKMFRESQDITSFLISTLKNLDKNSFSSIEVYDLIIIIIKIFKKLASYNLISNSDMIKIVSGIEKILLGLKELKKCNSKNVRRNAIFQKEGVVPKRIESIVNKKRDNLVSEKEMKLYFIIMKLIFNFNISYNDKLIGKVLTDSHKYPNIDSINKDKINFSFIKSDFGKVIIKLTIRVIYTIQTLYSNYANDERYKSIMSYGIKLLVCFLRKNDIYLLNLMQSLKKVELYLKIDGINETTDKEYKKIFQENNKLVNIYKNFFIFENTIDDIIQDVSDSLDNVLGQSLTEYHINNNEQKTVGLWEKTIICILKSNYYFNLSKFFHILHFSEMKNEKLKAMKDNGMSKNNNENLSNLIDKIFLFYKNFIYNSKDNSLILMSNYIFKDLCKAPIQYSKNNFDLFLEAIKNITNNSVIITNVIYYIKNINIYLEYLRNASYNKINECLMIFIKIIELLVLNIKSVNPSNSLNYIKHVIIYINEIYKISEKFFFINNNVNKNNKKKTNELKIDLLPYLKIINEIFDFTNEKDRKSAIGIINPGQIAQSLKNYKMDINLRTEILRFIRKIFIDLTYSKDNNDIYVNSIISTEDNLILLKANPLITNFRYPTKLLSFLKDFLNLSVFSEIKEMKRMNKLNFQSKNYTFKLEGESVDKSKENIDNDININFEKNGSGDSNINTSSILSSMENKLNKPCFDNNTYEIFINELQNFKEIISELKPYIDKDMEILRNYLENGLLVPIIYFLKKLFIISHCFSGSEMIKLHKLIIETCKLRLQIAEYKYDFWKDFLETNSIDDDNIIEENVFEQSNEENSFCKIYTNKTSLIDGSFCINSNLNNSTIKSLEILNEKKFLCYDFTSLYDVFIKNLFSLLKERKVNTYNEFYLEQKEVITLKFLQKEEYKLFPGYKNMTLLEKKIIRLYLLYKISKGNISNENDSSLLSILPEICLEYQTNYRTLIINFLINHSTSLDEIQEGNSFELIYKLLSLQTTETQNNLINLIGGITVEDTEHGFMTKFSRLLFNKIILLFIELFNAPDKLLDINYVNSFSLIKVFKFLCEEHNNFFQRRLIKTLNYHYIEITPIFYKENSNSEVNESGSQNKIEFYRKENVKNIKFFDFFLHVLLKFILISGWDNLDINNNYQKQNKYLYHIFEAILEMLIEIIQGNKPEFLNHLGNSIFQNEFLENLIDELESKNYNISQKDSIIQLDNKKLKREKIDAFQYFVKSVTEFIFSDQIYLELLYKIRNNLMEFFMAILEEKNCNENVQKFIIKYLNISRVFNSISSILKSYYISKSKVEEQERLTNLTINEGNNNKKENKELEVKKTDLTSKTNIFVKIDYLRTIKTKESKIIFNYKIFKYYKNLYYSFKEFNQTNEFKLSNAFYKYIKLIAVLNKSEEAKQLIQEAKSMREETAKLKFLTYQSLKKMDIATFMSQKETKRLFTFNPSLLPTRKSFRRAKFYEHNKLNDSEFLELNLNKSKIDYEKKLFLPIKIEQKKKERKNFFQSLVGEDKNEFDKDSIEKYYIIKFFESITTTVEVRTKRALNQIVIFTQPPEMIYLSQGTKSEFEREVDRSSETSKKNDLVRNVKYFQKEIKYYKKRQSKLSRWISTIDFLSIQISCYIYALIFNLFILFSLFGDTTMDENQEEIIQSRRTNKSYIQSLIDKSIIKWGKIYDIFCYIYVIINGFFILSWLYFRMPLYYKLDRLKYMEENNIQNKRHLKLYHKLYIILRMTIYQRDYISALIYEFIFSLISSCLQRGEIVYAFLLVAVFDINTMLKNIVISIKLTYVEVSVTFLLSIIVMYVFSNVGYFFFNKDFAQEIEYRNDNVCKTLRFCFLNTLDSGLRARGGIGDSSKKISYKLHKMHYVERLIFDDFFFLLIVIIAIDLVFGIIIRKFTILRNEEEMHKNDRKNHCFICHVNKNTIEKNRQNFNKHRNNIHYLWNYVDYMVTLQFSDVHDLNAINSYANQKIEKKDISWLPTHKDLKNDMTNGKKNEFEEEELKIEKENVNKYYVKNC